jgi:hypothetical protein
MKKSIRNYNSKGEYHGYQEWYLNGKLQLRCMIKNDTLYGYSEWHDDKIYYIK